MIEGTGIQTVELESGKLEKEIGPGELVHIPTAVYHSTVNNGDGPMKLIAIYAPFGPEAELRKMEGVRIEKGVKRIGGYGFYKRRGTREAAAEHRRWDSHIGAGAGTGISAKFEEAGGVDLIVIYNSGDFAWRVGGRWLGPMPYGDANAIVMDMAGEVLTVVEDTPVLAGVCGTDPFRQMDVFLREVETIGFPACRIFRPWA